MRPLRRIGLWLGRITGASRESGRVGPNGSGRGRDERIREGTSVLRWLGGLNDDLAGGPAPARPQREWRGHREGASGLVCDAVNGRRPEHN